MVNPSNLDSTWIKWLHKIPNHFLGRSGWWEMGKTRLSFPGAPSPARAARTAEGRDSAKKPVLACFDLNNFFFLLPLHPSVFPLEGSQRLKGCLFKPLFTPQTRTSPTQHSQATLANAGHSLYHGLLRRECDWREEVFAKHLSGPILQLNTQDPELPLEFKQLQNQSSDALLCTAQAFKETMDCSAPLGSQCAKGWKSKDRNFPKISGFSKSQPAASTVHYRL